MEQYIAIIKDDIKRFIKNYLIAGELVDMTGMSDLEVYIPSKYPYLSILYLLKQNGLNKEEAWFVENYNLPLIEETSELKKSLGHFLWNKNDVDELTAQLSDMISKVGSLSEEIKELTIQKEELIKQNLLLEEENAMLQQKVAKLTSKIEELIKAIVGSSSKDGKVNPVIASLTTGIASYLLAKKVIKNSKTFSSEDNQITSSSDENNLLSAEKI